MTSSPLWMWLACFIGIVDAHVPTYNGACVENCCVPPRVHTTSQVIYLKGEGGLEVHIDTPTAPFDIPGGELIDVDVVFRDAVDQSTYDVYIGCGGCVASQDPIVVPPLHLNGYQPVEVEPFTQTAYRSLLPKEARTFNASLLDGCTESHFTIRLVDYKNRSDGSTIVWAPVIGLDEVFTLRDLVEFPIYILRNHGSAWNDLGWTVWAWLIVGAPLVVNLERFLWVRCGIDIPTPYRLPLDPREVFYELAIIGFATAGLEELTHLAYAQYGHPIGYGFWVGLIGIIILAQSVGIFLVLASWRGLRHRSDGWCTSHPYWAPVEIVSGLSLLLLFGAGFYLGPLAIAIAGVIRLRECCIDVVSADRQRATLQMSPLGVVTTLPPPPAVTYDNRTGLSQAQRAQLRRAMPS